MRTSRSWLGSGSGRSRTALTTLNIVVLAPIPRPRVRTHTIVNPGLFLSVRSAYLASWRIVSSISHPCSSRCVSRSCVIPPSRTLAARFASSFVIPRRKISSVSSCRCSSSSFEKSCSTCRLDAHPRTREPSTLIHSNMASLMLRDPQHAPDHFADSLPVFRFRGQPFPSALRDRIVFRLAIVFRCPPGSGNPSSLQQPHQRRINRSLIDLQRLFADLFDPPCDSVAVLRPHRRQRFQHH